MRLLRVALLVSALGSASCAPSVGELFRNGRLPQAASAMSVSPDGRHLYSSARTDDGNCIRTVPTANWGTSSLVCGLPNAVISTAVSMDGRFVYAAGAGFNFAMMYLQRDTATGALRFVDTFRMRGNCWSMDLSVDGRHLYCALSGELSSPSSVVAWRIESSGNLTFIADYDDLGRHTSQIHVTREGGNVYAVNRNDLLTYTRDPSTGRLTKGQSIRFGTGGLTVATVDVGTSGNGFLYTVDGSGRVFVFARTRTSLSELESHPTTASSRGGLLVFPTTISFSNGASVVTFQRDQTTGKLQFLSQITDPRQGTALVGTEALVFTGVYVYSRQTECGRAVPHPCPPTPAPTPQPVLRCNVKRTEVSTGASVQCSINLGVNDDRTYSCPLTAGQSLEIDRVALFEEPRVNLLMVGWSDTTSRAITRFALGCQGPLTAGQRFTCDDGLVAMENFGVAENFELFTAPSFMTLCQVPGDCCVLPARGGDCDQAPRYTVAPPTPPLHCQSGWSLASNFTGLRTCLVAPVQRVQTPPRLTQRVERFGQSGREQHQYVINVNCEPA